MKPIAPNTLIQNRYLIVHLIGKGGMGEVYLAVDQRLGSAIALKRTFFSDDVLLGNAFEREARTLARLRHPVLPKVSDHFTDEGTQYLVMEHISGEDMSKRLEGMQKPFPLSWVLFWADQLLDSLNYLHTHEPPIIHRDIKPQNLKLTDENHIVLLDFGLSKNSAGETRATTTGSIVGYTPHYAPMEQIRGTGTDARSDLYSLSATLYQILTVNVPPDALTRADSLINGLPDPITPINEINTEVSKAVSDVIVKGMSISQEQRYKSAREMQKALRDAYAQMQTDMSANTVQYSNESKPEVLQSFQKTEVLPSVPVISLSEGQPKSVSQPQIPTGNSNPTPVSPVETFVPPIDFDATMRYDSDVQSPAVQSPAQDQSAQSLTSKQADIKTEVFLAGSSSAISSVQEKYGEHDNGSKSDFKSGEIEKDAFEDVESFSDEDDFSPPKGYSPDATVPLISFGNQADGAGNTATSFDSFSQRDNQTSAPTFTPPTAGSSAEKVFTPTVAPAKPKSKTPVALIGGIAALLILAISAVAVGWFVLRDGNAVVEDSTPSPTPEATFSVEPTVEPTLEVINDINTNTNGSTNDNTLPSNSDNMNTDNTNVVKPVSSPTRTPTVPPVAGPTRNNQLIPPTPTPRTVPPTPRPNNDRPPVTPKPTPTPKKPPIAS
jgi:serine/threonine protein kinase